MTAVATEHACGRHNVTEAWQDRVAYGVLHSDWLAAHDARIRASERERLAGEVEAE